MIHIIVILIKPFSVPSYPMDGCILEETTPIRIERIDSLCIDLQWPFPLRGQVNPNNDSKMLSTGFGKTRLSLLSLKVVPPWSILLYHLLYSKCLILQIEHHAVLKRPWNDRLRSKTRNKNRSDVNIQNRYIYKQAEQTCTDINPYRKM